MHWLPRVAQGYWMTPVQIKGTEIVLTILGSLTIVTGVTSHMFSFVWPYIQWCIGIAGIIMLAWIGLMQYTRFKENYYRDEGTEKEEASSKFALIPYLLIPILFAVVCGAVAMVATDIIAGKGFLHGAEEIVVCFTFISVVLYLLADYNLISRVGDVAYLNSLEGKVSDTTAKVGKNAITALINGQSITADKDTILALLNEQK